MNQGLNVVTNPLTKPYQANGDYDWHQRWLWSQGKQRGSQDTDKSGLVDINSDKNV